MLARARDYNEATKEALRQDAVHLAAAEPVKPANAPPLTATEKAVRLRDLGPAAYLYGAAASLLGEAIDVETWRLYLDGFLQELGSPADPVARLMIHQLVFAHHAIANLFIHAGSRRSPAEVAAYHVAITRLMSEFRRSALALRVYRQRPTDRPAEASVPQPEPKRKRPVARPKARRRGGKKKTSRTGVGSNGHRHEHEPAFT